MKNLLKIIVYFISFIIFLFILLPKENLYYKLEQELAKEGVIISDETINSSIFTLDINKAKIYVKGIDSANIDKVSLKPFFFFNKIKIENITLAQSLSNMAPSPIKEVNITYSIFDIFNIKIDANSIYGKIDGQVDLKNQKIFISLNPTNKMKNEHLNLLNQMKLKNGRYIHEYKY